VVIGEWGVIDLLVDPYSLADQGLVEVISHQMVDVVLQQPGAMAAMQDAKLS
jgi:hypothetical protein